MWIGQMPLAEHATLLMPDLPGFGDSDVASDEISMKSLADDIAEFLRLLDVSKVIFCGLSMGGYIGWEFAKHHSELLAGLICCNTRASADDELTARGRRVAAAQVVETGAEPVAVAMREKLFSAYTKANSPEIVLRIVEVIGNTSPEIIAAAQLAMAQRHDHTNFIGEIKIPTLVVAGSDDVITPSSEMQEMSFLIEEATFVEITDAGHVAPSEMADLFNSAVIHWLPR